jgi:ATP-dependent exoDNAse (exonuclease V) beta subunit
MKQFTELEKAFEDITFNEREHSYKINGQLAKYSVTKILKKYEKPFPRDKMAKNVAGKRGVLVEDILEEWDFKRDYSSHRGSEFHLYAENYLQRRQIPLDRKAIEIFLKENDNRVTIEDYYKEQAQMISNFKNFYKWWKQNYILVKSEFVVGDYDSGVCGMLDNLSYNIHTKKYAIFDYKTNKAIEKKNSRGDKLLEPFHYLDNCEYIKYSLQLELYKHIIEKYTSLEIEDNYIVWVNAPNDHELIKCLDLREEAKIILHQA